MMGRSHALSAAAGWLALCAAGSLAGVEPGRTTVLVGAGVAAGFALLPDLDHPGSTVARTLGPVTRGLSRTVSFVADWVQDRTCPCCADPDTVSHRGLTHTAVGAVWVGALVGLAGWRLGQPFAAVLLACAVALAVRGLWSRRVRGCRWFRVGSPRCLRFTTGGRVERWLVGPLLWLVLAGSGWVLVT